MICPFLYLGAVHSGWAAQTAAKEAELKQIRSRIDSIRQEIQSEAEKRDALASELKNAELDIQNAREELASVRSRRIAAETSLHALETEQAETRRAIDDERAALAAEVRAAYINGTESELKVFLSQGDPSSVGRMMTYYGYLGRARAERIADVNDHLSHLELLGQRVEAETTALRAVEDDNSKAVKSLAGARNRRAQTLAAVQSRIKNRTDQVAKLERDAKSLEQLIERLRRTIEDFPDIPEQPFRQARGKLPWPVKGKLTARFGQLRAGGPMKWDGVMIAADRGTPVRSPFYGRVVYADWLPGLGLLVVLDHGGGYLSLYGHNEQLYRKVGDKVAPGDVLGAVGDSGAGKSELYLEIRKGKEPENPLEWLSSK